MVEKWQNAESMFSQLEQLLGDPFDLSNPLGAAEIIAADEQERLCPGSEELLDQLGFSALYVPTQHGGQFGYLPDLVRDLRPVFSRDCSLGLGYGVTTLMAAVNVWAAGDSDQQASVAKRIMGGEKISVAYHELAHGNDFTANELSATGNGTGYRLTGKKEIINNAVRADTAVVFARTGNRPGRSHSLFLVDLAETQNVARLSKYRTTALRGAQLGGLKFDGADVAAGAMIGADGTAVDIALRSFQVTRTVMAGAGLGPADISLHLAASFAQSRVIRGRTVDSYAHARTNLAMAYALILAAEAAVLEVAHNIHDSPGQASVQTAAVKYIAPILVEQAMEYMAVVMGARFYLRSGPYALFNKHFRDLQPVGVGHAGGTSCLLTIIPQLRTIAGPPGSVGTHADFVDFGRLKLRASAGDLTLAVLPVRAAALADASAEVGNQHAVANLEREYAELCSSITALMPNELGIAAPASAFGAAAKYCRLLVLSSALGVFERSRHEFDAAWARIAVSAVLAQERGVRPNLDPDDVDVVFSEIGQRTRQGRSNCLDGAPVRRSIPDHK
ncbi:acyl-CoA dehydrogenase [Nocardia acidivorans]|uniref:acyl-CoA dehydrogenase n=1 Tax=Nocardia acidivorans TaxID=404580 RepID=UPI000A60B71C|nr:acyl-CoA dehydrogenase [Nocardia acidivorans]